MFGPETTAVASAAAGPAPAASGADRANGVPTPRDYDPVATAKLRLFVVHAAEDGWFVEGVLLKALELPDDAVLVSTRLEPGLLPCAVGRPGRSGARKFAATWLPRPP